MTSTSNSSSSSGPGGAPAASDKDRAAYEALLAEARSIRGVSLWQDAWRRLKRNWAAHTSLYFLVVIGVLALLTPALPLQSPVQQDLKNRKFGPPSLAPRALGLSGHEAADPIGALWHRPNFITRKLISLRLAVFGEWCVPSICGTDSLGRDILSRIFWGARVSLTVGIIATCVSLVIGVSYGATAGYLGGWADALMMRFVDILYSIPFIFVVIYLITVLSEPTTKKALEELGVDQMMIFYIAIGAIYWLTMSRVVRGQVISLKNEQFIEAARTIGATRFRIIFRHLIPNVMGIVIVYLTLTIPAVMLFEAFLSFLGLGVTPPDVSWGLLVNEGLQVITPVKIYWWLVLFPSVALTATLFALNFLGDGLRDALDPRMKNK